ncbi:MAG: PIN domain-containing protein [Armatimonadetes bacterium]|nr:PIN domain-containing protein [Armatimonadota bacterium]
MKLYLETTVPNFLFITDAPEKRAKTETLFRQIQAGRHRACVSALYFREVAAVSSPLLRYQLEGIAEVYDLEIVPLTEDAEELVQEYLQAEAFRTGNLTDALHVAIAARNACEVVVSWNFQHMVRPWTITRVARVHARLGLEPLAICTPEEVVVEGE